MEQAKARILSWLAYIFQVRSTAALWGYNPVCKVTPVILHGVVSPVVSPAARSMTSSGCTRSLDLPSRKFHRITNRALQITNYTWQSKPLLTGPGRCLYRAGKPHGGVCSFHQKSTCLTQLTLRPCVMQIWSRNTPESGGNEPLEVHRMGI